MQRLGEATQASLPRKFSEAVPVEASGKDRGRDAGGKFRPRSGGRFAIQREPPPAGFRITP